MEQTSYVKFLRGSIEAYNQLPHKDSDALYFVTENNDSQFGYLYFGDKLIAGGEHGTITLNDIEGIIIENNITDGSLLVYDEDQNAFVVKPLNEAINIPIMIGATLEHNGQSGLVPRPNSADKDKFLRGDATWANPTLGLTAVVGNILDLGNSYYEPTAGNPTTLVNEINYINEKLTWGNLNN